MKRVPIILTFCVAATAATAGSLDAPQATEIPFAGPVSVSVSPAWEGFYAGGLATLDSGEQNYYSGGVFSSGPWQLEGTSFGAFAGYNFQSGSLVYGAEAAYSLGDVESDIPATFGANYSSFLDIKARAGYTIGDALLYGVVGGSLGSWEDRTGPPDTAGATGVNYGLGVDYQVNDTLFVGAEYLVRDLSGDFDNDPTVGIDSLTQSAQIRVGLRF